MPSQKKLFTATALIELGAGLSLLSVPALTMGLLLGVREPSPEALVAGRIGGAGLLAIAVACWLGRDDPGSRAQHGLLWALLVYNAGAFAVLALAGSTSGMAGAGLWPAVGLHAVMTIWCALNLRAWSARAEPISAIAN